MLSLLVDINCISKHDLDLNSYARDTTIEDLAFSNHSRIDRCKKKNHERKSKTNSKVIAKVVKTTNSKMIAKKEIKINVVFECLHTISDTQIERDESFDDEKDEKFIKLDVKIVILIE